MIEICINAVPENQRNDPKLVALRKHFSDRLNNPDNYHNHRSNTIDKFDDETIRRICLHESGHHYYAAKWADVSFDGPHIVLDDGQFRFCAAGIRWSNSRGCSIEDRAKMCLAGSVVTELIYKLPDPGLAGDVADFRNCLNPLSDDVFEMLVTVAKASVISDLQNEEVLQAIQEQADEFVKKFNSLKN